MFMDRQLQIEPSLNSSSEYEDHKNGFPFDVCGKHKEVIYTWTFLTCLYIVFALPACLTILFELLKAHRRGAPFTPNDLFMLNIAVMDLLFVVTNVPGLLNFHIWKNTMFERFWTSTYGFNTSGRPLLMACICLDCYVAVIHPVIYHDGKSLMPRVLMVGVVWVVTVAICLVYFLDMMLFFSVLSITQFIIAIIIIGICDFFILRRLKMPNPRTLNVHPQKQRAIQIVISSLVVTVVSYLPPVLLVPIGMQLLSRDDFICTVGIPFTLTATLGSALMSVLHLKNIGKLDCLSFGFCQEAAERH